MKSEKITRANKDVKIYVGRFTTVHDLMFWARHAAKGISTF